MAAPATTVRVDYPRKKQANRASLLGSELGFKSYNQDLRSSHAIPGLTDEECFSDNILRSGGGTDHQARECPTRGTPTCYNC